MSAELAYLSAREARERFTARTLSPVELLESLLIGVQDAEEVAAGLGFVLRQAGLKRLGEVVPEAVEP